MIIIWHHCDQNRIINTWRPPAEVTNRLLRASWATLTYCHCDQFYIQSPTSSAITNNHQKIHPANCHVLSSPTQQTVMYCLHPPINGHVLSSPTSKLPSTIFLSSVFQWLISLKPEYQLFHAHPAQHIHMPLTFWDLTPYFSHSFRTFQEQNSLYWSISNR